MAQWVKMLPAKLEWPEFDSWDPHGGSRKLTPKTGPLSSSWTLWHV